MKYDVFISYSRKDFDEVTAIIEMIKSALPDITYWFDITGIESGDEFEDKIISAIDNSSYVLFALSENSLQSQWTKDEVMYARNTDKKIIPVLLKDAKMKGWFLFKFGRVDCIDSTDALQIEKLVNNISSWTGRQRAGKNILADPLRSEPLCPCGSGKLFKDCHGRPAGKMQQKTQPADKVWKVGDYYDVDGNRGVVYQVDESGRHGKIVSARYSSKMWAYGDFWGAFGSSDMPCNIAIKNVSDSVVNMQDINGISEWKSKYPAFAWCSDLGPEWSLPAVDDYKEMLGDKATRDAVNATLRKYGEEEVFDKSRWFWSSLENNNHAAYYIYCSDEFHADTLNKSNSCFVRAIRRF